MTWLSSVDLPSQLIVGDRLFSYQPTLQNRFQCLTIPSSDLITAIHDESRILSHPIAQRLEQTQSRLRVDYPDKDRFFVFCWLDLPPNPKGDSDPPRDHRGVPSGFDYVPADQYPIGRRSARSAVNVCSLWVPERGFPV